ncbi:MAG: TIGR04255 family protein [Chloroflexi bacterium]|nr:TIGR04255 family protein [Chloroflexota bacterium]MBU1660543.1 TIGR04255 family protein [Chloroflexota bacterium]
MAINFPSKPEMQLSKAPVDEVICQVRFPLIFRINKEEPSEFQEEIRSEFPKVEIEQGYLFPFPSPGGREVSEEVQTKKTYRFRTMDEKTAVSLSSDFYALLTTQYTHWNDFSKHLKKVDDAIKKIYKPAYGTRIGLRFVNRITSNNTGLQTSTEILQLINSELTAYFQNECWTDPLEMESRLLLSDGDARLNLRTRHGKEKEGPPFFILDFDYFEEGELSLSNLVERCDAYHDVIYRAFRWCIPDESLNVFEPFSGES